MNTGGCADPHGCEDTDQHLYEYQHHELTRICTAASRNTWRRVLTAASSTPKKK